MPRIGADIINLEIFCYYHYFYKQLTMFSKHLSTSLIQPLLPKYFYTLQEFELKQNLELMSIFSIAFPCSVTVSLPAGIMHAKVIKIIFLQDIWKKSINVSFIPISVIINYILLCFGGYNWICSGFTHGFASWDHS